MASQRPGAMRQSHAAGDKLFVDFAGDTLPVFDALTAEAHAVKILVAVLGAPNSTNAEARWSEALPNIPRRVSEGGGLRQAQGRGDDRQPLPAGDQPDPSGARRPLWHRHSADAPLSPTRRNQRRRAVLIPDQVIKSGTERWIQPPAQPALPVAARVECRHPSWSRTLAAERDRAMPGITCRPQVPSAIAGAAGGGIDLGSIVGQLVGGGVGGAILTVIVGLI
jgi:hypothetical protein